LIFYYSISKFEFFLILILKKQISVNRLTVGGVYQWKRKGEFHLFNPQTIHLLQHATKSNDFEVYKKYARLINDQSEKAATLRSQFKFKKVIF
jgi:glutamate synthase (NADPH/NADH) large chain